MGDLVGVVADAAKLGEQGRVHCRRHYMGRFRWLSIHDEVADILRHGAAVPAGLRRDYRMRVLLHAYGDARGLAVGLTFGGSAHACLQRVGFGARVSAS